MGDGRRAATATDIRAALGLYRRADAILIGLVAMLASPSSRQAEQPVQIDMRGKMRGQPIQRLVDQRVIPRWSPDPRQSAVSQAERWLIVDKQPVNIGSDHTAVGRNRALRRCRRRDTQTAARGPALRSHLYAFHNPRKESPSPVVPCDRHEPLVGRTASSPRRAGRGPRSCRRALRARADRGLRARASDSRRTVRARCRRGEQCAAMSMWKPACAQCREIRNRRFGAEQDDEIGIAGKRHARPHAHQIDRRARRRADRDRRNWRRAAGSAPRSDRVPSALRSAHDQARARLRPATAGRPERTAQGRAPASRSSRAIVAMPSANSVGSPRNLLTRKPRISAASAGSMTALVPTRLAITPPRSMSPIEHDRHVRRAREPHIGDIVRRAD